MAIRFLPNDPLAGPDAPPLRRKSPLANRPTGRAGFTFHDPVPEGLYDPDHPEFLFWQCREAALLTLATWERHAPVLREWQGGRAKLHLYQNAVAQLDEPPAPNAFYDRTGFLFFEATTGGRASYSGQSTDVVAHEIGHGLLDALRPDLWDTPFLEVNAFHEAFGDCMALLTALHDARTRSAVLRVGLGRRNFVETFGEDLAAAVRRERAGHNAAVPRRALNRLQWQLPSTLPPQGGPGELIAESHSFARIFTGCFWDLVRTLAGEAPSSAALRRAALRAGTLLVRGASAAPEVARFFRAVGSAMALADEDETGGAHRDAIRNAFSAHGIALGSHGMLAPTAALEGPGPNPAAGGAPALAATTRRDLRGRLGTSAKARMVLKRRALGGSRVVQAMHLREVPLGNVSDRLRGVVALAPEGVLIGRSGHHAALLGALPEASATRDEVLAYVTALVAHDRIDYGTGRGGPGAGPQAGSRGSVWHSHTIRPSAGRRRVLTRVRFSCQSSPESSLPGK